MRIVLFVALAGCSSLDDVVWTSVTTASLRADPANGPALADVEIELLLDAGPRAHRTLRLDEVYVNADAQPRVDLAVAFPWAFDTEIHAGEKRTVMLDNVGTTNAMLTPLCGLSVSLTAWVGYEPDDGTRTANGPFDVPVVCP
jgi:hypothetical protein